MSPDLLADLRTLGDKLEHGDSDDKACAVVIFAILGAEAFGNLPVLAGTAVAFAKYTQVKIKRERAALKAGEN